MADYGKPGRLNLNANNLWPGFRRRGLELGADGVLRLFRVPRLLSELPPEVENAQPSDRPSAVAVAAGGTVYYSDGDKLRRVGGCEGDSGVLAISAAALAPLDRGTVIAIADSASPRLVLIDVARSAVVEVWKDIEAGALASDGRGNLYVAEAAGNRVRSFDRRRVLRWDSPAPLIDRAVAIAVSGDLVFALGKDLKTGAWQIVSWNPVAGDTPRVHGAGMLAVPAGLAASSSTLYVGDNQARRILAISISSDSLSGAAVGYRGPVAALALGSGGDLFAHCGSAPPLRLSEKGGAVASGVLWGRVNAPKDLPVAWHRARATVDAADAQSHFQFFIAGDGAADPSSAAVPFGPDWEAKGLDVGDFFVGAGKSKAFWLGVHLFGDGSSTPALSQIEVNYDQPTYLASLPPVYRDQGACGDFLPRYLALFESFFAEAETEIRSLSRRFDPDSAPTEDLQWLGSWLGIDWDERWDDATQRDVLRRAFAIYARRGTKQGLRDALELFAGVRADISEPIRDTAWWGLPAPPDCSGAGGPSASILGTTTGLAVAEPQGAVVGVSAVLDRSHLIRNEDYARPLFEHTAHQFSVVIYSGGMSPDALDKARAVLDREKPAHTIYELSVIEPQMRVGLQARIGIDAYVAGVPPANRLGTDGGLRLAGEPGAALGGDVRIGVNTRL